MRSPAASTAWGHDAARLIDDVVFFFLRSDAWQARRGAPLILPCAAGTTARLSEGAPVCHASAAACWFHMALRIRALSLEMERHGRWRCREASLQASVEPDRAIHGNIPVRRL